MYDLSIQFERLLTVFWISDHEWFTRYRINPTLLYYLLCRWFGSVVPVYCFWMVPLCGVSGLLDFIINYTSLLKPFVHSSIRHGLEILRVILSRSQPIGHPTIFLMGPFINFHVIFWCITMYPITPVHFLLSWCHKHI